MSCLQASLVFSSCGPSGIMSKKALCCSFASKGAHLMGMSCPGEVGCFEEGVGCASGCNARLSQCCGPSRSFQIVTKCLPHCHFDMEAAKHDYTFVFTMCLRPVPLNIFGQCVQWCVHSHYWDLSWIQELCGFTLYIHPMLDHGSRSSLLVEQWQELSESRLRSSDTSCRLTRPQCLPGLAPPFRSPSVNAQSSIPLSHVLH